MRATELLDYTPGGPDFLPTAYSAGAGLCRPDGFAVPGALFDRGGANEVHGESGDDTVYGGCGNDRLFGDAADDDLIGGWGLDWISGGSGQDGVIGDDGRIFTSRNGTAEPLYGIAATTQQDIAANGNAQAATINVTGTLAKAVDITPFNLRPNALGPDDPYFDPLYADDVIFGGLGDDFLHGAAGDDAISGAEALPEAYAADRVGGVQTQIVRSDFTRPYNPGELLHYGHGTRTNAFALYDGFNPLVKVTVAGSEFFLNFDAAAGPIPAGGTAASDGRDLVFGGDGHDWLVGGSGRDDIWGGWGDDLLNTDDNHGTHGGLNDQADENIDYSDRAYGGAGLDVLLGNSTGDRLIDWVGEFNSYFVPFNPFGLGTVSRQLAPGLAEYLYALSKADGADPTRATDNSAPAARNGEPQGEVGLLEQQDPKYEDQRGSPSDPQGPIGGGTSPAVFVTAAMSVAEGAAGTTRTVTLTLTLSSPAVGGETVAYATSNGTATAGSDYTAASGVVTFAAGATTATLSITVLGDDVAEPDESFGVTLSSPSGLVLGSPSASTITITNDDVAGARSVSIADTSVTEGPSGSKTVTLTLTLSAPAVGGETVLWMTADGTAASGSDYTAASARVTFAPGATSATFTITVLGDATLEPDETFAVTLSDPTGGLTLGTPSATVTILNDDAARSASIADASVTEGNSGSKTVTLTVTLSAPAVGGETVAWVTSSNGSAAAGSDYTAASGTVTFGAGATSATFTVTVLGDNTVEGDETFVVTLSNPTGGLSLGVPSSATVTILNDDAARAASIADVSVSEGTSGSKTVTLTVTLSAPAVGGETVAWVTSSNGSAAAGSDYTTASGTVTFGAGATSATFTVTVLGDNVVESDETFVVTLSNPTGGLSLGSPSSATVTILNDDAARAVTIAGVSAAEGNTGSSTVTLTLTLSAPAVGGETVAWATSNGTATTANSDYTAASGTVTFAAGATTATISVTIRGDRTVEGDETFVVTLSNPTGGLSLGTPASATVTIVTDDGVVPRAVTITGASTAEGNSGSTTVTLTLTLSTAAAGGETVAWVTSNGTATAGTDYTAASGIATFAAGALTTTITLTVLGDATVEPNETFTVTLSNPTGSLTLGSPSSATVTITNDDVPPSVSIAAASVNEGATGATTPVTLTLTLSSAATVSTTVAVGDIERDGDDGESTTRRRRAR